MGIIGKTLRFIGGLAIGAAAGTVGAMLLAPLSGARTRGQIKSLVDEAMEAGKQAQRDRERELQHYWEQQVNVQYKDGKK
jgi:gas vesicle protein